MSDIPRTKGTFYIILSSKKDLLIDEQKIEERLTDLIKRGFKFECIKKSEKIELLKSDLDAYKDNCIYVVNPHEPADKYTYWQLGYAIGKGIRVIRYKNSSTEDISDELKDVIEFRPDDWSEFVKYVHGIVHHLTPVEEPFKPDWETQVKPARREDEGVIK